MGAERMQKEEEQRRREADQLKAENETRKTEIHGLKDILVRENENRARETDELRMTMELANQTLGEALEKEANDLTKRISNLEEDIGDEIKKTKKELKDTIDTD